MATTAWKHTLLSAGMAPLASRASRASRASWATSRAARTPSPARTPLPTSPTVVQRAAPVRAEDDQDVTSKDLAIDKAIESALGACGTTGNATATSSASSSTVERLRERLSAWESVTVRISTDVASRATAPATPERSALDAPAPITPPAIKMIPRRALLPPPPHARIRVGDVFSLPRSSKSVVGFDAAWTKLAGDDAADGASTIVEAVPEAASGTHPGTGRTVIRVEDSALVPIDGPTQSNSFHPPARVLRSQRSRRLVIALSATLAAFTIGLVGGLIARDLGGEGAALVRTAAAEPAHPRVVAAASPIEISLDGPTPEPASAPIPIPLPVTKGAVKPPPPRRVASAPARSAFAAPLSKPAAADLFADRD